jgi:hypothetical protein
VTGRGCLEPARDLGRAVERKEVVLDLDFGPEASGKKGQVRLDFLTRFLCSSLCIISIVRVGPTIKGSQRVIVLIPAAEGDTAVQASSCIIIRRLGSERKTGLGHLQR